MGTITLGKRGRKASIVYFVFQFWYVKPTVKRLGVDTPGSSSSSSLISYTTLDEMLSCEFQLINNYCAPYLQCYLVGCSGKP